MRNLPLASRTTTSCSRQTRENSAFISNIHTVSAGLDRQALDHHASQHCENRFHRVRHYNCTNKYINEIKWMIMPCLAFLIFLRSVSLCPEGLPTCGGRREDLDRVPGKGPLYGHRNMEKKWRKLEMDIDGVKFTCNVWLFWWGKWFQPIGVGKSVFFRQMYTVLQGKASFITHKINRMAFKQLHTHTAAYV